MKTDKFTVYFAFVMLAFAGLCPASGWSNDALESGLDGVYVKMDTWQETMLACREQCRPLLETEAENLGSIKAGPWRSAKTVQVKHFSDIAFPKDADRSTWRLRRDIADEKTVFLNENGRGVTYLSRTIDARGDLDLPVYINANNGVKVWINGAEVFAKEQIGFRRRYQVTARLSLRRGRNELVIAHYNNKGPGDIRFSFRTDIVYRLWEQFERDFPVQWDWIGQDASEDIRGWFGGSGLERKMIKRVLEELGEEGKVFRERLNKLIRLKTSPDSTGWLDLYVEACEMRRSRRLQPLLDKYPTIIFTKHHNLGGSHYAYTEAQSDAQRERNFSPGASLCRLEMNGIYGKTRTLLDDADGIIRDPDVSMDAEKILFSWKKSDRQDDFHLYEMDAAASGVRQLTFGLGFADYEGAYLPDGNIVFSSTRCVQTVDCFWTEVSNIYTCNGDGKYLRRLGFDQVHTNYPAVMPDGRVIYTRWEYNDRGHLMVQPLFQMNPDGTGQTEFYGNNSWFPTTIMHARGIPGTEKVLAIAGGHHARQAGKLIVIDPKKGRQENSGVQLVAPVRETKAERIDAYGQFGEQFQYPYPVSETQFLVAYEPLGWSRSWYEKKELFSRDTYAMSAKDGTIKLERPFLLFKIYLMDIDGRRELLAADPDISCNQPVPLAARNIPVRANTVDYTKDSGVFYLKDIYAGQGLTGVRRGTIKKLRVIALKYRAAGIGANSNRGSFAGALVSTPIAIANGSWDVKVVLGDARVYADGSACFEVPARTPVYFQALDAKGRSVQTMRSWSTLQPGEYFSCIGCHEDKNETPKTTGKPTMAMRAGPKPLEEFYGPARGFSYPREIQPILDRHCIACHDDRSDVIALVAKANKVDPPRIQERNEGHDGAFSLLGTLNAEYSSGRAWSDSYLMLTHAYNNAGDRPHLKGTWDNEIVNWVSPQSAPSMIPPYYKGSTSSRLLDLLERGHEGVRLSHEELEKISCWIDLLVPYCGDYTEANVWADEGMAGANNWFARDKFSPRDPAKRYDHFLEKRKQMERIEQKNIEALLTKP